MVEYYTKLKVLRDGLYDHDNVLECTYVAVAKYAKKKEVEEIHQFLVVLNAETYENVCFQILNLEPLMSLGKVYFTIAQEKRQ